jgi:hypothetical protein
MERTLPSMIPWEGKGGFVCVDSKNEAMRPVANQIAEPRGWDYRIKHGPPELSVSERGCFVFPMELLPGRRTTGVRLFPGLTGDRSDSGNNTKKLSF